MRKVFFDTETSSLTPGQIGQLSMITLNDNGEVSADNYFFEMDYISPSAEDICGRGLDFYKQASAGKRFEDYKDELLEKFTDSTLIAHNLKFDENFLSTEFWRQNIMFKPADRFDTMLYFKDICKIPALKGSKYKNPKLEEVVDYFNIDKAKVLRYSQELFNSTDSFGFHDSRYDTTSMFVFFQIYAEMQRQDGDAWRKAFVKQ